MDVTERRPAPIGDHDALRRLYDELAGVVVGIASAQNLVAGCTSLVNFGVEHLGADAAGVTRRPRRGGVEMLAATDPAMTETWSAPAAGESASTAAQLGLRSTLLIGLPTLGSGAATLELYSRRDGAFDAVPDGIAAQITALAGTALRDLDRRTALEGALQSRGVIGQAQGIVMERYGLTGEQAMSYLRRHSQESHQPVRALAIEIVEQSEAHVHARGFDDAR